MRKRVVEHNVNLCIRINEELRDKLNRVAKKHDVKASQLLREFIKQLEE